jgi:hypothetical protein
MFKHNIARATLVSAITLALVATTAGAANAAAPVSDGPVGLFNPGDETPYPAGTVFKWDDETVGAQSATEARATFECPADATQTRTFISAVGAEKTLPWIAYAEAGYLKSNLEPTLTPESQILGSQAQARATGGDFSIGVACVKDNGVNFASSGLWFTTIHVTPGTGAYTVDQPGSTTPPAAGGGTADIALTAQVAAAADGALSLVVPAGAAATIGAPTIVNGVSTSAGTLPDFTVKDARALTHTGWTLTSTVTDFVAGTASIPAAQLTVTPVIKSTTAAAGSVTAAPAGPASNTGTPFASATDNPGVGDTVLNAGLSFAAPSAATPAGTYTSKMTLTLVSK